MDRYNRQSEAKLERGRTGRRKAVDIDSPRDKSLCFMVSEEEKHSIDLIGMGINKTRSALLARIVNTFAEGVFSESEDSIEALISFQKECREMIATSNNPLIKRL